MATKQSRETVAKLLEEGELEFSKFSQDGLIWLFSGGDISQKIIQKLELAFKTDQISIGGVLGTTIGYNPNIPLEWFSKWMLAYIANGIIKRNEPIPPAIFLELNKLFPENAELLAREEAPAEVIIKTAKRFLRGGGPDPFSELLKTVIGHKNTPVETIMALFRNGTFEFENRRTYDRLSPLREALATRKDLWTIANCDPDFTAYLLTMEQSDNEYVCARLAANPSLPPEVLKEYLKAKRRVVRLAAYTNPSIPDGDLEKALRGRGTEKAAAMQNPKTPQRVRLLAGVEHNVINFTKGEPYIKCRKTPEELSFSSFFYRLGSSGAWEEKAGNEQLAREIRGWPLNKNSDIDFYVSPGTEGIEFEKLSSLEEAKSWFAWKSPESNKWTFCIRQGSQAGKEGLAAMTADLPVATDGWLSIKQHTDPNKYVIMGATPEGDKRRHYWITTGKKEKLLMNLVPPYNLKAEYPWPNKPTTTASLLGIFILYGGLFALWGVGGQPVGWTQEEGAGDVPNKKILTKTKLCETKMISKILGRAESLLRAEIKKELSL